MYIIQMFVFVCVCVCACVCVYVYVIQLVAHCRMFSVSRAWRLLIVSRLYSSSAEAKRLQLVGVSSYCYTYCICVLILLYTTICVSSCCGDAGCRFKFR